MKMFHEKIFNLVGVGMGITPHPFTDPSERDYRTGFLCATFSSRVEWFIGGFVQAPRERKQ